MACCSDGNKMTANASASAERVCIEVKRVFDAGLLQDRVTGAAVTFETSAPQPLTFVSAMTAGSKGTVGAVSVDPIAGAARQARVRCTVGIPLRIVFVDAANMEGFADGVLNVPLDVVMSLPEASVIPFEFESVASAIASEGVIDGLTATVSCCTTVILKIVVETELIVSSFGYCRIPPMERYSDDACAGFFELPLYPGG